MICDESNIQIIKNISPLSLQDSVYKVLNRNCDGIRSYKKNIGDILSWEQYGKRLDDFIKKITYEKDIDNLQ